MGRDGTESKTAEFELESEFLDPESDAKSFIAQKDSNSNLSNFVLVESTN